MNYSCEFLSIWYFYRSSFNKCTLWINRYYVVSSFQFGIFTEVLSTIKLNNCDSVLLWVPFNLVFLPKFFQLTLKKYFILNSCEFLSIWYFYRSSFNCTGIYRSLSKVVSSFQFGIFTEVLSTKTGDYKKVDGLWVPFNLVFLPKFFQLIVSNLNQLKRCEFLSIWYFYRSSFNGI